MDKYQETFNTWNNIAALYQEKFMELDLYNDSYDYICNTITKQKASLLEIGCGPGNITKYLLSKRPDFDILGIDIAKNMIELAKLNNPTANFRVMDCRNIHHLNTKFDAIIGGFCLPYLSPEESTELISSAYNLLNENGLIYLSFVEGDPARSDFKVGSGGRVFFYFHDAENLKKQLKINFFDIKTFKVKYQTAATEFDIHTILITRKKTT